MTEQHGKKVLVGCPECRFTWIVSAAHNHTTACPSCGSRWKVDRLRTIESGDESSVLRHKRGRVNAERIDELSGWKRQQEDSTFAERVAGISRPPYRDAFADAVASRPILSDSFDDGNKSQPLFSDLWSDEAEECLSNRGPETRESECTGAAEFLMGGENLFPWSDDPTGDEKTRLVMVAATLGDSPTDWVPFYRVLEAAFDDGSQTYYGHSDRLAEQYPDLWQKRQTESIYVEVRPTSEAVYLIRACNPEKPVPWRGAIRDVDFDGDPLPLQRFSETVGANRGFGQGLTDGQLGFALNLLADHRSTLIDEEGDAKTLTSGAKVIVQRFASASRAQDVGEVYDRVANEMERRFDWAVVLTLTLPRAVADSALHSYVVIADAWETYRHRLPFDPADPEKPSRPGYVPPYLWVQEPHRDGWAHRHVIFGGERRLMDADDVRRDWAECLHIPDCVDLTPWIRVDTIQLAEGWHVVDSEDAGPSALAPANASTPAVADGGAAVPAQFRDAGGLRRYYRKGMTRLVEIASLEVGELRERADRLMKPSLESLEQDRELARLSFMWAAEARFTGASDRLRRNHAQ